jgi:hypothetical protein
MMRFDAELTGARWPHDSYARGGAHGLTDQDIDSALAFFARAREPLPLDPPLASLHRPVHHAHDAAPAVATPKPEEPDDAGAIADEEPPRDE